MQVLYVTTPGAPEAATVLRDLLWLEPGLEVTTIAGAPGALTEACTPGRYAAIVTSPSVPHDEVLALIASIRVDRFPIAILPIVAESDQVFRAPAVTAGADEVLVLRGQQLIGVEDAARHLHKRD